MWWWGQAQGFAEQDACVAFAGGEVSTGPFRTKVTALVVPRRSSLNMDHAATRLAS